MRLLFIVVLALALPSFAADELKGEAKARLANIDQFIDDWDIPDAKAELEELKKIVPPDIEPVLYYEGRIALEEGRYQESVDLLTKSGLHDKAGGWLRLAKDTYEVTKDDDKVESEHFIFFFPKGKDSVLAPYALQTLEKARAALEQDLGYAPPGKIRVEVLNDATELSKLSTLTKEQIKTTGTIAICKFNKLMVTSPKAVLRGYDWLDTLNHEYVHLVVSQKSHNAVPIWLHEGIAKYLESRWRGAVGLAMTPATLALLGRRVKADKLVPFEKMHPSIAMLPSAEDAATAFAEVFFAIDLIWKEDGNKGVQTIIEQLRKGESDKHAVEVATGKPFAQFEKNWLAHVKKQDFPKEFIPLSDQKVVLKEDAPGKTAEASKKSKEITFGDFQEVEETDARKMAHLGELFRERGRFKAAAEEYGHAYLSVGDKYESVSNKYARALVETGRFEEAEKVLLGSLRVHPGVASTNVQLGRIRLRKKDWKGAKDAYLDALAEDPFDPEVHLALTRAHKELGEEKLEAQTLKATVALTGLTEDKVKELMNAPIE
ncbi:MAG: peptidase MA family metallohydrolase [Myxococcaceae bacterium]